MSGWRGRHAAQRRGAPALPPAGRHTNGIAIYKHAGRRDGKGPEGQGDEYMVRGGLVLDWLVT